MELMKMENISKSKISIIGLVAIFMSTVYYLPSKTFISFFAAGLFLIPTSIFIYMINNMNKDNS
jgi:hypothetical protein